VKEHHCVFILAVIGLIGVIYFLDKSDVYSALHVLVAAERFIKAMTAAANSRHPE